MNSNRIQKSERNIQGLKVRVVSRRVLQTPKPKSFAIKSLSTIPYSYTPSQTDILTPRTIRKISIFENAFNVKKKGHCRVESVREIPIRFRLESMKLLNFSNDYDTNPRAEKNNTNETLNLKPLSEILVDHLKKSSEVKNGCNAIKTDSRKTVRYLKQSSNKESNIFKQNTISMETNDTTEFHIKKSNKPKYHHSRVKSCNSFIRHFGRESVRVFRI